MHSIALARHRAASYFLAGWLIVVFVSAAKAQDRQIAQIKTLSGTAFIVRSGARLPAKIADPLLEKDTIETGSDGAIGLTFIDNTVMSAGPNSEVVLEDYKFDSSNFKGAMLTDMRKGTLSMVSGDIARSSPGAMKVKTPAAILGVRGTKFVIEVDRDQ